MSFLFLDRHQAGVTTKRADTKSQSDIINAKRHTELIFSIHTICFYNPPRRVTDTCRDIYRKGMASHIGIVVVSSAGLKTPYGEACLEASMNSKEKMAIALYVVIWVRTAFHILEIQI